MSFLGFFSRRSGKTVGDTESWQVGDWAECIGSGRWFTHPGNKPHPGPRHGQVMRVIEVMVRRDPAVPGGRVLTLAFAGWPDSFFEAAAFRKLNPRADEATAAEAEFTALVRRKPAPALPRETIEEHQ